MFIAFDKAKSSLTYRRLWKHTNRRRLTGLIKIYRNDIDKVCWLDSMSVVLQLAGYRVSIADQPAGACWWHKHASRQTAWGSDTEYLWGPASVPSCSQMTQKPLFLSHSCKTTKSYLVQLQITCILRWMDSNFCKFQTVINLSVYQFISKIFKASKYVQMIRVASLSCSTYRAEQGTTTADLSHCFPNRSFINYIQ